MAIIQVWSLPAGDYGAHAVGALYPWVSAGGSEAFGTPASFRVTVTRGVADASGVAEGHCLRVLSQSRGEQWWFVSSISDSDGDGSLVTITCGGLEQILTRRGLVREDDVFSFTPGRQTITDLLTTYVFTNLSPFGDGDAIQWLTLGTIDFTDTIEIGSFDRVTRWEIVNRIERETGHTAKLRPVFVSGLVTSFALDIKADHAAGLPVVPIATGVNGAVIQRTRDAARAATVVVPFSASGSPMDHTQWVVGSFTPGTPAWIPLTDPVAGQPGPIREDNQGVAAGWKIQRSNGSQMTISGSRASDSAVQIASSGGYTAGERVTLVRNAAGDPVIELMSPAGLASSRGRLVATVGTSLTDVRRNYAINGLLGTWASETSATGWTGTMAKYPRTTPTTLVLTVTAGAANITAVAVSGTANARIFKGDIFLAAGTLTGTVRVTANTQLNGSGTGTVALEDLTGGTSYAVATSDTLTLSTQSNRPASFPTDGADNDVLRVARVAAGSDTATTPAVFVNYDAGRPYLHAAAGVTHAVGVNGPITATSLITLAIRNTGAGTTLASVQPTVDLDASSTRHETLSTSTLLSADITAAVRFTASADNYSSSLVRWVSLWLDTSSTGTAMGPQSDSASNVLWHRGQDVLEGAGTGERYTVRGVDLALLSQQTDAIALGQRVRLRSPILGLDTEVTVVKLDYTLSDNAEALGLECGTVTPRLTGVTVAL